MDDITKEQIEDTLNIARMLDTPGLLDLRHIVKIKQLALIGLEAAAEIERLIHNGEKLFSETLDMADKAQNYEAALSAALKRVKELEAGLMPFAKEAWSWEPDEGDSYVNFKLQHPLYGFADNKSIFTLGDLRRAAELLKDREPK